MAERTERITFAGSGGEALAARLDTPPGAPIAYALFAHCFTCTKDIFAASRIAAALTGHGIAVLRFDFTGLGSSEGEFANTNFSSNVDDLVAAADFLRAGHAAPKLLIGHSLGGAAVLAAASRVPESEAVVTIGAPAEPAHVAHHMADARAEIEARGEAEVLLVGRPFRIKKQFLEDIEARKLEGDIGGLRKALLVFHAPRDTIVGIDNAARIFQAAKHPKSFVSLDGADHLLSKHEDAIYVAQVTAAWAERYLGPAPASESFAPPLAESGEVVVAESGADGLAQSISFGGRHDFAADEPASFGGARRVHHHDAQDVCAAQKNGAGTCERAAPSRQDPRRRLRRVQDPRGPDRPDRARDRTHRHAERRPARPTHRDRRQMPGAPHAPFRGADRDAGKRGGALLMA